MPRIFCPTLLMILLAFSASARAQGDGKIEKPKSAIDAEKAREQKKAPASGVGSASKSVVPKTAKPSPAKTSGHLEDKGSLSYATKMSHIDHLSSPNDARTAPPHGSSQTKSPARSDDPPIVPHTSSNGRSVSGVTKTAKENSSTEPKVDLEPYDLGCGDPKLSIIQKKSCRDNEEKAREKRIKTVDTSPIR